MFDLSISQITLSQPLADMFVEERDMLLTHSYDLRSRVGCSDMLDTHTNLRLGIDNAMDDLSQGNTEINIMNSDNVDYRMKVHVFGNTPSPAVAIYGLRRAAREEVDSYESDVRMFVEQDFYVDDALSCFVTEEETISVLQRARGALALSNLRLHKIASNRTAVMYAIPTDDLAKDVQNLDLSKDELPLQRILQNKSLDVQFCLSRIEEFHSVIEGERANFDNIFDETVRDWVDLSDSCLTPDKLPQIQSLLSDFADVFSSHPYDYGLTDLVHHTMDTDEAKPIKLRPYRTSPAKQIVLQQEVDKLSEHEKKWSTFDRELYAIVWSVRHFRHYLAFHRFTIITDHKSLVGLKKLPVDQDPTGRRTRRAVEMDLHDWSVVRKDGTKHLNADAMSRRPNDTSLSTSQEPSTATIATQTATDYYGPEPFHALDGRAKDSCHTSASLIQIHTNWDPPAQQQKDPDITVVLEWLDCGRRPPLKL
ncbi:hypothetical protein NFI96_005978 [Prochilodus magdalenae]|nr:hypothetical protein NFI96_005978 [Prochilodus magdalenae]